LTVYYILLLLMLLYGIAFRRNRKRFVIIAFGTLILFAGLRSTSTGADLFHYIPNFEMIANTSWSDLSRFVGNKAYDYGFVVLLKLLGTISNKPQFFVFITSLLTYGSVGRYIYKYSEDAALETFLFVTTFIYFMYMTMIAEAIAIAIILFGLDYLQKKRYVVFSLFVLLAATMHSSAIICLGFIPLYNAKQNKKNIALATLATLMVFLGFDYILDFSLKNILPSYAWYQNSRWASGSGSSLFYTLLLVFYSSILILSYFGANKLTKSASESVSSNKGIMGSKLSGNFLVYMALIALLCRILKYRMSVIERFAYYVYLFAHTLFSYMILVTFKNKTRFIVKSVVYIIFSIFYLVFAELVGVGIFRVVPYEFFWQ